MHCGKEGQETFNKPSYIFQFATAVRRQVQLNPTYRGKALKCIDDTDPISGLNLSGLAGKWKK